MKTLDVYLHGRLAGRLTQDESGGLGFAYDPGWLAADGAVGLSQSLPLRPEPFDHRATRPFFAGLLPEGSVRERVARALGTSPRSDFGLLDRLGGETAGALILLPAGTPLVPPDPAYRPLDASELAEIVRNLPRRPLLAGERGVRLSLAGAQDKVALLRRDDGSFAVPLGGTPSSHLLKTAIRELPDTVVNEAFCLELAARLGMPAARPEVLRIDGEPVLAVERYDRVREPDGSLRRLHQEDFCQALGVVPENKYEADGGHTLAASFALVARSTARPAVERLRLLDAVVFDLLIGNHDAHGKNFSLVATDRGIELAPRYDVLSTAVYPELSDRLAMKLGGERRPNRLARRHFARLAEEAGLAAPQALRRVATLARRLPAEAAALRTRFVERGDGSPVLGEICVVVERRSRRVLDALVS